MKLPYLIYLTVNSPTRVVDPARYVTDYTYDEKGNLLAQELGRVFLEENQKALSFHTGLCGLKRTQTS
ncbi:MAG TPA: hypothetical protein DEF36_00630 [Desulfotomaculum sp.]|nr:hypothetical protein [Desulfotomaculum sp.]